MLVVIGIIGIMAALLLPALTRTKARAKRIECVSDLKETGVACHLFANDHNGKYPTQVTTNDGGALEFVTAGYQIAGTFYFSYKFIQPLAATITDPKLFACPADLDRWAGTNFTQFGNSNLSYDVGLVTDANDPRLILAADRGLPAAYTNGFTIRHLPARNLPQWSGAHGDNGNVLFSDGHVDLSSDAVVLSEEAVAEDVAYPSVKGAPTVGQTGGGNGGGGGTGGSAGGGGTAPTEGGAGGAGGPTTPTNLTGNSAGTNSAAPVSGNPAAGGSAQSAPAQPGPNESRATHPGNRPNLVVTAPAQGQTDISNPVSGSAIATTNSPGGPASRPGGNDTMMSPFDRAVAAYLRDIIVGTYLLILLLLLLFVAYRIWRWTQNPERKRRRSG